MPVFSVSFNYVDILQAHRFYRPHPDTPILISKYISILTLYSTLVSGGKKCSFFGKFGLLCFLETPVLRFAHLLYYRLSSLYFFTFLKVELRCTYVQLSSQKSVYFKSSGKVVIFQVKLECLYNKKHFIQTYNFFIKWGWYKDL